MVQIALPSFTRMWLAACQLSSSMHLTSTSAWHSRRPPHSMVDSSIFSTLTCFWRSLPTHAIYQPTEAAFESEMARTERCFPAVRLLRRCLTTSNSENGELVRGVHPLTAPPQLSTPLTRSRHRRCAPGAADTLSRWLKEWVAVPQVVSPEGTEPPTGALPCSCADAAL